MSYTKSKTEHWRRHVQRNIKKAGKHYDTIALAVADVANINIGDVIYPADRGGTWDAVDATTVTENEYNIVTGNATVSFQLRNGGTLDAKEWGATGGGTIDDSGALQAVLDEWKALPNSLLTVPPGTYKVSTALNVTFSTNDIAGKSILAYGATFLSDIATGWLLTISSTATVRNISIAGLLFRGNASVATETGMLKMDGGTSSQYLYGNTLRDIYCDNTHNQGIALLNNFFESSLYNVQSRSVNVTGVQIEIDEDNASGVPSSLNLFGCITSGGSYGINIKSPVADVNLFGCTALGAANEGILMEASAGNAIYACHAENNQSGGSGEAGIKMVGHGVISGCFGTSLLSSTQAYVVEVQPTGHILVEGGLGQENTVKYLNILSGAGTVTIIGDWEFDAAAGVPYSVVTGERIIPNTQNSRIQNINYASSITPVLENGSFVKVAPLTGNIIINDPTGTPIEGDELIFYFIQNGVGGYSITFNAVYTINWTPATVYGDVNTISFKYINSEWVQVASSVGV